MKPRGQTIRHIAAVVFWLLVWQGAAMLTAQPVFFPTPADTARAVFELMPTSAFWVSIGRSVGHVLLGFSLGAGLGIGCAFLSFSIPSFEVLLAPLLAVMTAVPVVSFIILAMFWLPSGLLVSAICVPVVMPILYNGTLSGLRAMDERLNEMATIFGIHGMKRFRGIVLPQLAPFWTSALRVGMGMAWKSGIAAEVIAMVRLSMGHGLYLSKIYLEGDRLFAWTVCIVLLSAICGKLLMLALSAVAARMERIR